MICAAGFQQAINDSMVFYTGIRDACFLNKKNPDVDTSGFNTHEKIVNTAAR